MLRSLHPGLVSSQSGNGPSSPDKLLYPHYTTLEVSGVASTIGLKLLHVLRLGRVGLCAAPTAERVADEAWRGANSCACVIALLPVNDGPRSSA